MQEVYLLNLGDSINRVKCEYGDREYKTATDSLFDRKYTVLKDGSTDIRIVRNYLPIFLYKLKKGETQFDIMSRGYEIVGANGCEEGDILLIHKPKSIRYTVSPLDKLEDIAKKYGISKYDIMSSNNLNTDKLFVGQILWI